MPEVTVISRAHVGCDALKGPTEMNTSMKQHIYYCFFLFLDRKQHCFNKRWHYKLCPHRIVLIMFTKPQVGIPFSRSLISHNCDEKPISFGHMIVPPNYLKCLLFCDLLIPIFSYNEIPRAAVDKSLAHGPN